MSPSANRVDQVAVPGALRNHETRIRILEAVAAGGSCPALVYVGTASQTSGQVDALGNSVPALIAANPGALVVPFENGWNNSLGPDSPVAFGSDGCYLWLQGGFVSGSSQVVFTLPAGYIPSYRTPFNCAFSDLSDIAEMYVDVDGTVNYLGGF